MEKYITMDIGGTFLKYGVMDREFHEEAQGSVATEKEPERFMKQLIEIVREAGTDVRGVAISIGGFIDPVTGSNTDFSVGENLRAYNLKEELSRHTGLKVAVENDSNCAALAELMFGAGRGCLDFCVITLGTGIGGAIIHDRKLLRGRNNKAGEFGFTRVGREEQKEGYSYQAAAATSALVARVCDGLGRTVDGNYVFDHLENQTIRDIYTKWLDDLAMVVGNVAVSFDPEKVLIGGGISARTEFIDQLKTKVYHIFEHLEEYTAIEACGMGNNAGKVGALINYYRQYDLE